MAKQQRISSVTDFLRPEPQQEANQVHDENASETEYMNMVSDRDDQSVHVHLASRGPTFWDHGPGLWQGDRHLEH